MKLFGKRLDNPTVQKTIGFSTRLPRFVQPVIARMGHGNLLTLVIAALMVLSGRQLVLSLADRIPDRGLGLVVHEHLPINLIREQESLLTADVSDRLLLKPFDTLSESNHIEVDLKDITATNDFWLLDWWSKYLLKNMPDILNEENLLAEQHFWLYRDDNKLPAKGTRTGDLENEWLLMESQFGGDQEKAWYLRTALAPAEGLVYFRLDAQQYQHGELKTDESILNQAEVASQRFIKDLNGWIDEVSNEGADIPVCLIQAWPDQADRIDMEGLICHVVYEDQDGQGSFVVFYNVAIMQVVGFSGQAG